jgi:hypothetical protein
MWVAFLSQFFLIYIYSLSKNKYILLELMLLSGHLCSCNLFHGISPNVVDSVPFRPERPEYLVPACEPVRETHLFHLGLNTGPFRVISGIPGNFRSLRPDL